MYRKKLTKAALSGLVAISMIPAVATPLFAEDNQATETPVEKATEKQVHIVFLKDGKYEDSNQVVTVDEKTEGLVATQITGIPEGYELTPGTTQWTIQPDGELGYAVYVELQKKEVEPEEKFVNVTFELPAATKGYYKGFDGADALHFDNIAETDGYYTLGWFPEVVVTDEYSTFTGWKVRNSKGELVGYNLGPETFEYTFTEAGDYTITPVFTENIPEPEVKKTANVFFNVDPEKGSFTDYGKETTVTFLNIDENSDQQFEIPAVTAKEGYKFVGWKGQGADVIEWGADAKTFGVTGLCSYAEGITKGYATIEAVFEKVETPAVKRTANVYFNVDPEKGSFTDYGKETKVTFLNIDEFNDQQFEIPAVTAKEGYKFVGWKGQGADVIEWGADATTFGVTGLCHYEEGATEGYATIEAVFEKVETPEVKRTANVYFTVDSEKGEFVHYGEGPVTFLNLDEFNDQQLEVPEVKAKEGYKFVGWKGQGADVIEWDADAKTFGVTGLCHFAEGATEGYASIEAVFEKVETPAVKRTANVYFNVDPEKGSFTEYGEGPVTFLNLDEFNDQQLEVPAVTAKEGYKFVGWKGQGADVIEWDAEAKTFGVTGLCHFAEGATEGYATIEAVFEKVETPETKRTANVYFNVDPEKGSFTEYGEGPVTFLNLDEFNDQQLEIPAVTAKEGYKFVGWKGQGADVIEWDAEAKTFGVTGLCHFAEGATEGYATIEAVFEKVETPETEKATATLYVHFMDGEKQVGVAKVVKEGVKGEKVVFDDYKVAAPKGYKLAGELPVVEGVFGDDDFLVANVQVVKEDAGSVEEENKTEENKTTEAKKEENKVTTGVATGVFGSLAGLTAAGAGIVALLRRRNSK